MLLIDPRNPRAKELAEKITENVEIEDLPVALVFGGDGWMLDCIRAHGPKHIYMGLNAGTLGFLMNDNGNPSSIIQQIREYKWQSHFFPRLSIKGLSTQNKSFIAHAVNDVYVARQLGRAANLRVEIDGTIVVDRLICDGLIVATSLGSTAYSSSAGGSPSHPLIRAFHVTPICPHTPRLRSFVVPQTSVIRIQALHSERRPVQAVSDGVSHGEAMQLEVACAQEDIRIAFLDGHNFTENMINKVLKH